MSKDRPTSEPGGCECMKCGAIFIGGPAHDECGECATPARESVADALMIVESYGPWGADLNGVHRQEIILADEVHRLRESEKALVATLRDEMDEGLRLRELGGARPDEGITAMTERIVAENAQLRAEIVRLYAATEPEKHAHTDWVDDDVRVRHPRA